MIWGGLFVCIGVLQSRYFKDTYIQGPISLISGDTQTKIFYQINFTRKNTTGEFKKTIALNNWDSIVLSSGRVQKNDSNSQISLKHEIYKISLNEADSALLESLPGIGPYSAKKIVAYRNRLGGFISKFQLWEIPYIDSQIIYNPKINWVVNIDKINRISLIDLNISAMYKHPYIGKTLAKNLIEFHKVHGPISIEKFLEMKSFDSEEKKKLRPYFTFAH